MKIIEEWLKNYKSKSLTPSDADDEEELSNIHKTSTSTPYENEGFKNMINSIIENTLISKVGNVTEVCIAVLSILNHLDS
jgi:hypothetical protein